MTIRAGLIAYFFLFLSSFTALTKATPVSDPCPKTSTSLEWSSVCFETTKTGRQVAQQYKQKLVFDAKGFAAVIITSPAELVAVNRRGQVVRASRENLSAFIFEPSEYAIGRFGYVVPGSGDKADFKCGFFQRGARFKVVIPPVYDQCDEFVDNKALVCIGCINYCKSGDCHRTDFIGGEGLFINAEHQVLRRFPLPLLPRCAPGSTEQTGELKCRQESNAN